MSKKNDYVGPRRRGPIWQMILICLALIIVTAWLTNRLLPAPTSANSTPVTAVPTPTR